MLEKALLLQRTLLTGKKEPNVAANELAVKAVDQENTALEQEINNLKTELELRRTLAGNSAMAIVQRHGTRAAGSRGIFEGDTTRDRLREVQKPRATRHDAARMDLAAAAMVVQPPRRRALLLWVLAGRRHRGGVNIVGIHVVGSIDGWSAGCASTAHFFVWRLLLYGDGLRLVVDASAPARARAISAESHISACCASRSRPSSPSCCSKAANCCAAAERLRRGTP